MSIHVTKLVWEASRQKSGNLLVLLAISDHAANDGAAYPGIKLLARKARLSERHVRRCICDLLQAGELTILPTPAPGGGPWYQIQLNMPWQASRSPASERVTSPSAAADTDNRAYIIEPSTKPLVQPCSDEISKRVYSDTRFKGDAKKGAPISLISPPKNGF